MLNDRVNQKYGCGIRTGKLMSEKYYVYLDDGLYTGSRLRKDIKHCIEMIPEGSRIDVIYMIACQSGLDFSKRILEELCKTKNIKINILRWREICNNKKLKGMIMEFHMSQFRIAYGPHQSYLSYQKLVHMWKS